ncbi:hypothetical protein BT96DRAFT_923897 [Gymnopus androsaceus JB14]|uniref:Uncharacterized protein n=1 Tax=Gymnopus androsaceus JB14 TaxID=1447944 RepID=A0A6A4H664_9AGAR|nr:hypothetical protein BT96DRAFT_923897 [Gymnopus androsaceus JB14]
MLYKVTIPAVLAALLLQAFSGTGVAAEPLPQVISVPPAIIDCKGPNDHHTGPTGELCCANSGFWACQSSALECSVCHPVSIGVGPVCIPVSEE